MMASQIDRMTSTRPCRWGPITLGMVLVMGCSNPPVPSLNGTLDGHVTQRDDAADGATGQPPTGGSLDRGLVDATGTDSATPTDATMPPNEADAREPVDPDAAPAHSADAAQDGGLKDAAGKDAVPLDGGGDGSRDGGRDSALRDALPGDASPDAAPDPLDFEQFPWFFSIHGFEVNYDIPFTERAFAKVVDLGGRGVRTDIFWKDVEPERDQWDQGMMDFYDAYIDRALANGLVPMMIVSGPAEWAIELYRSGQREAFWAEYEAYLRRTVALMADRVDHYQLWNEPNHLIDVVDSDDDWQLISRAGRIIREMDPNAVLYVNLMANVLGWEEAITDWVTRAGDYIDVIGVDHYPGTWACCDNRDWTPLRRLVTRINDPEDVLFGKLGCVMETGFSSWAAIVADEGRQRVWINESLPVMRTIVEQAEDLQPYGIVLGNYYQLIDVETDGVGQEAHFGILHSDLTEKEGYADLRRQLATF